MKLSFEYTNNLVDSLLKIEKYKTALDYLLLSTREKQKLMYEANVDREEIENNEIDLNREKI